MFKSTHHRILVGPILVSLALSLASCGTQKPNGSPSATEATLKHGSGTRTPAPYHTAYLAVPVAKKFFQMEHLTVKTTNNDGTSVALQALSAGQVDVASGSTASFLSAKEKGLDAETFLAEKSAPIAALAVLPNSKAKKVKDLFGKTIGVSELGSGTVPLLKATITRAGGDPGKIKIIAIGAGPEAAAAVEKRSVDAFMGTTGQIGLLRSAGLDVRTIKDPTAPTGFDTGFFATPETIKNKHDELVKFARGVIKGWIFSTENPRCAVKALWKVYPESKPTGVSEKDAMNQAVGALKYHQSGAEAVLGKWGNADPKSINATIRALVDGGALKKAIPAKAVWTGAIVDEAVKDVDEQKVRSEASKQSC